MNPKIKVSYVSHMGDDLTIVNAARVSFNKSSDSLDERDKKLIRYLAEHNHMSPFEHCTLTVIVEVPLYIRSQIHRHRTFAYNEISRRYTSENLEFYVPDMGDIRKQSKSNRQASDGELDEDESMAVQAMMNKSHTECLELYNKLIDMGVCREQARGVLPQNLMTKFYMTGNLRNFAHFLKLRSHKGAQQEVQEVADQLRTILTEKFPQALEALTLCP
jgi:thymidylate synthase (FAD)